MAIILIFTQFESFCDLLNQFSLISLMSQAELRERQAAEHSRAAAQHAAEAGKDVTSALGQRASEAKEKVLHTTEELSREAQLKARQVQSQAKSAWRDSWQLVRSHPLMAALMFTLAVTIGMVKILFHSMNFLSICVELINTIICVTLFFQALAGSGFTFGFLARDAFSRYGRSSPQYKAHQALDTVLQSYYGSSSKYGDEGSHLTTAALHKLQDAYHDLTSMLGVKKFKPQQK